MPSDRVYVVAGNHQEFKAFVDRKLKQTYDECQSKGTLFMLTMSHFQYVHSADTFRGVINPTGYFIGTWKKRKDLKSILTYMQAATHGNNPIIESVWRSIQ
jgi:hypothetical protein